MNMCHASYRVYLQSQYQNSELHIITPLWYRFYYNLLFIIIAAIQYKIIIYYILILLSFNDSKNTQLIKLHSM